MTRRDSDPPTQARPERERETRLQLQQSFPLYVSERHDASGLAISRGGTGVRGRSFAGSRRHPRIEAALSGAKGRAAEADDAQPRSRAAATNVGHIEPAGWYRIIYPCLLMAPRRSITPRATCVCFIFVQRETRARYRGIGRVPPMGR